MKLCRNLLWLAAMLTGLAAQAGTITYYHNDIAGSPVVATDASGNVLWRESYRPYGERLTNATASVDNKVWFTSRRQDVETGLVYMGARYYDPVIGRFISKDPVGFDEGNLHTHNRYAYANNNPYKYRDPNGLWAEDIVLAVPGLVLGGLSLRENLDSGQYLASAVDVVGPIADGLAAAIPGIPGGAGLAIGATRKAGAELAEGAAKGKSVSEMAAELKTEIGRNSVPFTTVSERGHIDLAGKSHFDKSTGATIPTPHVQSRSIHRGSEGQTNLGPGMTRPATKQDIRMARELEKRRD